MPSAGTSLIFLLSALLCIVSVLFLGSLLRSGIPGLRAWSAANVVALIAFFLYALDNELPPLLTYEGANSAYAIANACLYVGFRRFFRHEVPWLGLCPGLLVFIATVSFFHYVVYSFALRTIAVSVFSGVICFAVAKTITSSRDQWRTAYPYGLTAILAVLAGVGHFARAAVHRAFPGEMTSLLQPAPWNLFFITLGTLVLPALTMGAIIMVHDRMLAEAEYASKYDFLTGALSRRAFFEAAYKELRRSARTTQKFTLLIFDVDHFKKINDTYGHAVGDQVLVHIAKRVQTLLRASDYFGRIGGEEFALLFPETGDVQASIVAERLRHALDWKVLAESNAEGQAVQPAYTVSIGFAVLDHLESLEDVMARADAALYDAKSSGRNLAVFANSGFHSQSTHGRNPP
jgi:diguanylate cyclase (GGDEF)-like protein